MLEGHRDDDDRLGVGKVNGRTPGPEVVANAECCDGESAYVPWWEVKACFAIAHVDQEAWFLGGGGQNASGYTQLSPSSTARNPRRVFAAT